MAARYSPACGSIRLTRWPRPSGRSTAAELAADVEQRANAALAVAKAATLAALELGGDALDAADRAEVLALALRTLEN